MRKKVLTLMILGVLSAGLLVACGKDSSVTSNETPETTEATAEAEDTTEDESAAVDDFTGDFDLEGSWIDEVSKRATMDVIKNSDGSYDILVSWGGGVNESAKWQIHGQYDEKSGMLSYTDGKYAIHTFDDDGKETLSDETTTEGAFLLEDGKLRWQDSKNSEDGLFVRD